MHPFAAADTAMQFEEEVADAGLAVDAARVYDFLRSRKRVVVITGAGCRCASAVNLSSFESPIWFNLLNFPFIT
jgi:hypothetical protein